MKIKTLSEELVTFIEYIISELLSSGFLLSIFYFLFYDFRVMLLVTFMISESCNSQLLFSLIAPPTPYSPSKTFFWIKMGSINKNFHLRDLKDAFPSMNITLAYFANFNFAHFEIEKKICANLGKITKWSISLANFHFR